MAYSGGIQLSLRKIGFLILVGSICLTILAGCSNTGSTSASSNPPGGRETIMQVSSMDAIMEGIYDGALPFSKLKEYGDLGIGAGDKLNGEMMLLGNDVYEIRSDGVANKMSDVDTTPFASVTFFDADIHPTVSSGTSFTDFKKLIDGSIPTVNAFYAIKMQGTFSYMKTRCVPGQQKPYPRFSDVTAHQPEFEFNNEVSGTVIGFLTPPYVGSLNVPGYHLHFLTDDKKAGGHILDFKIKEATVSLDETTNFLMILPGPESDYYKVDLSKEKGDELKQSEGG
jgi:acetolactate decarboxylase